MSTKEAPTRAGKIVSRMAVLAMRQPAAERQNRNNFRRPQFKPGRHPIFPSLDRLRGNRHNKFVN